MPWGASSVSPHGVQLRDMHSSSPLHVPHVHPSPSAPATSLPIGDSDAAQVTAPVRAPTVRGQPRGAKSWRGVAVSRARSHSMVLRSQSRPNPGPGALVSQVIHPEPTCYLQAALSPEWREAMDLEFNALL